MQNRNSDLFVPRREFGNSGVRMGEHDEQRTDYT